MEFVILLQYQSLDPGRRMRKIRFPSKLWPWSRSGGFQWKCLVSTGGSVGSSDSNKFG